MNIILKGFNSFSWKKVDNIYFIGSIYNIDESLMLLKGTTNFEDFNNVIRKITGNFSIIIQNNDSVWACVDNARSFPLFFSVDGTVLSDRAYIVENELKNAGVSCTLDILSFTEMLTSRNTKYDNTVYNEIKQINLGHSYCFSKDILSFNYYKHINLNKTNIKNDDVLTLRFLSILNDIFKDCLENIGNKQIIVPLSGGYDSRLLLSSLKRNNINNVICYTYGRESDYDVLTSKEVASKLGYKWYFVPYNKEDWDNFWSDDNQERIDYFNYTHNHSSVPHIQDFIALQKLKSESIVKNGDVVLPGFCADLPAGSFVEEQKKDSFTNIELAEYIYNKCFINIDVKSKYKKIILARILENIKSIYNKNLLTYEEFISIFNCWFTADRPSKWVVNSVRVFEFFGLEWRLPFWDYRFLDFFYSLNYSELFNCRLYKKIIFNEFFIPLSIDIKKTEDNLSIPHNKQKPHCFNILKRFLRNRLIDLSYSTNTLFYNRNGVNNYNYAAKCIYKKLKDMKFTKGKYGGVHQIEMIWWCVYMYGKNNVEKVVQ